MHHNFLNEEPQQLRCQRLNVRVPLRFVEERCRIAYRLFQPMYFRFSLRERFYQLCLFICVAGREQLELFCRDAPQYAVFIELLENRIQLGFALLHGGFLLFQSADLFLELCGLFAVQIFGKFLRMLSGFRRHPAQILQHDLIENALSDVMCGAGFTILFVSTAGEVVVVGGHCMRPVEHHCFATIGTNYQSGILVLLIHLRSAALILPYPLHNIPNLFGNDGRMRIFKHETFFSWVLHLALVLIGPSAEPVVHSVAKIDLIFQQVCNGTV